MTSDTVYSSTSYTGASFIDNITSVTNGNIPNITYYQVETEGETTGGTKLDFAPTNAGYYYASITVGDVTVRKEFTILPRKIVTEMANVLKDSFEYDGTVHEPIIEIIIDGKTLMEGRDYTLSCDENAVNLGNSYIIKIVGKGNYTGTVEKTWKITDETAPIIADISDGEVYYGDVIFTVSDAYLDKVYVDDKIIDIIDGTYTIFADNKKHTIKAIDMSGNEVKYTITVNCEEIDCTVYGYSGIYDGQSHGITVSVEKTENAKITYSTDGETYSENNPQFIDKGNYIVYYKIQKESYNTVEGQELVSIQEKDITITAKDQNITCGDDIDKTMYTVTGLQEGDKIKEITLTPSTIEITENGTIEVSEVVITNADNKNVTENYNVSYKAGKLTIKGKDKIATEYEILEGEKSTWNGENTGLTIRGSGDFDKFTGVKVDDILISEEYYDAKSGSTIVTLKDSYLESLSIGIHTVEIIWTDGSVKTTFTILEKELLSPATNDGNYVLPAIEMQLIILIYVKLILKRKTRKM